MTGPARVSETHVASSSPVTWSRYLADFHATNTGITEDVLSRATFGEGVNPYEWIAAPVVNAARTLDLACGSGPCLRQRSRGRWFGVDRSMEELSRAHSSGPHVLLQAEATALPFASDAFDAVVCSMAVMLMEPLAGALAEVRRVLRPGGLFVVTMPGRHPIGVRDVMRYVLLVTRMGRRRLTYPNERVVARARSVFRLAGFDVVEDRRGRFQFPIGTRADAEMFVRSLYLPGITEAKLTRGTRLASQWVGSEIAIPLRRVTLRCV